MMMSDDEMAEITGAWDYSTLPSNIRIGRDCFLERRDSFNRFRSTRDPGLVIDDRVRVYTWTTFNVEPAGLIEVGHDSILVGAVFMCADHIRIGQRVIVSYNVTIADSDFHPLDPEQRKRDAIANAPMGDKSRRPTLITRPVVIEDDAWIGIGAIILKGVRIGAAARIGAGAVVARDVPPGQAVAGNPARLISTDGGAGE
jgi:acetyltransferase-like isoleucine patch superfamily enzyme